MADKVARYKQYEYRANSNLVLMAERTGPRVGTEPTGEPESLWGRLRGGLGDRVVHEKPPGLQDQDKLAKLRQRAKSNRQSDSQLFKKLQNESVLAAKIDQTFYKPKTRETRAIYEKILDELQSVIVDQPSSVLEGCADEILYFFKNDNIAEKDKKTKVLKLLAIPQKDSAEKTYTTLHRLAKEITDYVEDDAQSEAVEGTEINLVFSDEESQSDSEQYEVRDESDDEEDGDEDRHGSSTSKGVQTLQGSGLDDMVVDEEEEGSLDPRDIDAFWVQREVSKFESDKLAAQKLSVQILKVLKEASGPVDLENHLVEILGYSEFAFVKTLLQNRYKILYCSLLKQAQSQEEKLAIREEMQRSPELVGILDLLEGKKSKTGGVTQKVGRVQNSLRREIRKLKEQIAQSDLDGDRGRDDDGPLLAGSHRRIIDFESLGFHQGSHLMSNKVCELPPDSKRQQHKGYDEVFIPATIPEKARESELVPLSSIPEWARLPFQRKDSKVKTLNRVQSRVFQSAFFEPENLLICAPTGSGKTNCAMLTMLHEIGLHRLSDGTIDLDAFKIVYIAPMKSLVREMVGEFGSRLECYGISVKELSGDVNLTKQQIAETQVIITTPEKWDIVTRKSGDRTYTQLVRLMIIDEIHLLHDERGAVLESIIARTCRQIESTQEMIRIVGLSATLPNYEDVATFCRVKPDHVFAFDSSYRAVPLEQQYIGINLKKPLKKYQLMNELCYEKVMDYAGEHQVLVFVHSRKDTIKTARMIRDQALANEEIGRFLSKLPEGRKILHAEADNPQISSSELKELLPYGIAIHHAGMSRYDRGIVEDLFKERYIQVLVSTATLAWGVNLPARAVIIKGTEIYNPEKGAWTELSSMDVMQMLGRAGRPGYDDRGEGVVITSGHELQFYLSLMNAQLPIESQFLLRLADHMNAEIVMGTIQTLRDAAIWLGYTYLYICMLRSPTLYGISYQEYEDDPELEQRRLDLVHSAATLLDRNNLIKYDRKTGDFQVTNLGRVASHFYISYSSIATYNEHLKPTTSDIDLFRLFSLSEEFRFVTVRQEERIELEKLLDSVPIPVKEGVDEPCAKVNVLLQSYISRLSLEGFALAADMVYITQSASRIMRALFGIVLQRGWSQLAQRILQLCKMIAKRMWGSQTPLRQFPDIPPVVLKRIEGTNIPFERLYDLNSQELAELISHKGMGRSLFHKVHQYPRLELRAQVQPITPSLLKIDLTIIPDFSWAEEIHGTAEGFWVLVEDVNGEQLLHHEYFVLKSKYASEEQYLSFTVALFDPLPPQYFLRVVSDRWLGPDAVLPVSFRHLILPAKYPPPTELLDLQPLPVTSLRNPKFERFYEGRFTHFNSIQTQVFQAFYTSTDSILLGAPTGSGKTVCLELAIFQELARQKQTGQTDSKIIYIAPYESLAQERFLDWQERFESHLQIPVVVLSGELNVDLRLLASGRVIISTPEQWDMLSRRWKQRKNVRSVSLFLLDELHLLSGQQGHTLEVIASRMRRMAHLLEKPIRMIGSCTSIANSKSLGEWLGAGPKTIFNFAPSARPVPVEIHLKGFDESQFELRLLAMSKPAISSIHHHAGEKPVIIFAPSRRDVLRFAQDLKVSCDASISPQKFLHCTLDDLLPHMNRPGITNRFLKELLGYGIGIYHEHLSEQEKGLIEQLFEIGAIQLLVSSRQMCWGMNLSSYQVIIMGTQFYDGKEHRYVDYPIADVLQMIGRANRPGIDQNAKIFLMCYSARKEFYKKFLFEPLPVESHLDLFLADHLNAEAYSKTVEDTQDAIDFLTWTLLYRRLTQNPNYYNLQGVSHRHLCDHLSDLVESTLNQLEEAGCALLEPIGGAGGEDQATTGGEGARIEVLNPGIISAYYYIKYDTIELFTSSLSKNTKLKGLIEILSNAKEFSDLPIRHREAGQLNRMAGHLPVKIEQTRFHDPPGKVNVLLQAHFSRLELRPDLKGDQKLILKQSLKLIYAMVDVITTIGVLKPALCAMELAQMVVQGMWVSDPILKQLPFFTDEVIERCSKAGVNRIEDITELEDDQRNELLQLSDSQLAKVAEACNRYPDIEVAFQILEDDSILAGESIELVVQLDQELDEDEELGFVFAPHYPKAQLEEWWVVVGDHSKDALLAVKRVQIQKSSQNVKLSFTAPQVPGEYKYTLMVVCDSYIGCDMEYELPFRVLPSDSEPMNDDDQDDGAEPMVE